MATSEQEKSTNQTKSATAASSNNANGSSDGKSEKSGGGMEKTGARPDPSADAVELLKSDHRKVEQLFADYEKARRRQEKAKIAQQVCRELIVHAEIEEEIFYPACRAHVEDSMLDEAQVEHDGAKILIGGIVSGSPSDAFYDAKVKVLSEYIRHHVQEEEKRNDSIFAQARTGGLDMAEIGQQMLARKDELKKQMEQKLTLPQPLTLDVFIGEDEAETEETMASRDYGRGRYDEEEDRRGRRMPERDEYGRFVSDEESEGGRNDGGRGGERQSYRGREDDRYTSRGRDDDNRYSSRGREDDDRGSNRGGGYARGGQNDDRRGGYSRGGRDEERHGGRGGDYRSSGGRDDYSQDRGQGGWFGDSEGHSEAARKGWDEREREGSMSRSSGRQDYDERRYSSRERDDDDRRPSRSGGDYGRGGRGGDDYSQDRGQGGWFGDAEGHSEAARRGWENRR